MASLGSIFLWWMLSLALSFVTLPLSTRIFRFLPDKGVGFSRLLGLVLTSYLAWVFGFALNSVFTSFLALAIVGACSWWVYQKDPGSFKATLKEQSGLLLIYESLFFFLLLAWSLLRMHKPDIVDQEKFMDFAFFNALTRAGHFPPFDPWLAAPKNWLNYYYFGYFSMAQFARMTFLNPAVCYNLVIAFVFALSGTAIVSLGYNLTRALWPGFAGLGLLQVFGNLHGGLQLFGREGFSWWEPTRMIKDVAKNGHYLNAWWWSADPQVLAANQLGAEAARDGLISEFPVFSFIHGDMHPHFTAIPFVLLTLAFGLNLVKNDDRDPMNILEEGPARASRLLTWGGLALCLGLLFMTNTWDVPAYGVALSLLLLGQQHQIKRLDKPHFLKSWLIPSVALLAGLFIVALPFVAFFESPAKLFDSSKAGWQKFGVGMAGAHTGLHDTLIFWGGFLVVLLPFVGVRLWLWAAALTGDKLGRASAAPTNAAKAAAKKARNCDECGSKMRPGKPFCAQCGHKNVEEAEAEDAGAGEEIVAPEAPELAALFLKLFTRPAEALRDTRVAVSATVVAVIWLVLLFIAPTTALFLALALACFLLVAARQDKPEAVFALALVGVASLLVAGTEWFYLRDVFEGNPSLTRMNTIFKFYFQAWILFAAASPFALHWTYKTLSRRLGAAGSMVFILPVALAFLLAAVYPLGAIRAVTAGFANDNRDATLDGSDWLKRDYPLDHAMILWLRDNIKGKAVIAEAVGGAYTRFARVSAYTGLASVCGWGNHESQWRRVWPTQAEADVNKLYETSNLDEAKALIAKYGVQYVFVGSLEHSKYSPEQLAKFGTFMEVLHGDPAGTVVYKTRS
jgi:uncharacterized membrane protein